MAPRQIIPAHDERVMVTIEIPRKDKRKKPLQFIAPRFEFLSKSDAQRWADWLEEIVKPVPLRDEDDNIIEGEFAPQIVPSDQMFLDWFIENLDMADADELLDLTRGEKKQIWSAWQEESAATLGESAPSSDG